jgi:hypothetical protein
MEAKMIDLKQYLTGIAIGIKFRPNYSIEDNLGEIIDELLYRQESLFNYVIFPNTSFGFGEKILHNSQTNDKLTINKSNIILEINFSDKIPKEKSDSLINEYFKTVTEKIYKIVNIHEVYLIGIVYKYLINDSANFKNIYSNFKEITFGEVEPINFTFTRKVILPESKIKKDKNDYENIIHTILTFPNNENEILLQVDYQKIFYPKLASIVDIKYDDFISKVKYYNNDTFTQWLEKNNGKK